MMMNFHFHRLSDGTVIVHSHLNTKKHNHTKKEIIVLDKYYTAISKTIEYFSVAEVFQEIENMIYDLYYKSELYSYSKFIYGHFP